MFFMFASMLFPMPASTAEVAGILVPYESKIAGFDGVLLLNGAEVREKFSVDVYLAALYVTERQAGVGSLLEEPPANRVSMHFVYSPVTWEKLTAGWQERVERNLSAGQSAAVRARLDRFAGLSGDLHEGDAVYLDYIPGDATEVSENGVSVGMIDGRDFNSALLGVWLGEAPATESLKKAMVGVDKQ